MTITSKQLLALNGYSVRVDLPEGLTEDEYNRLVHHTHHLVLKKARVDVISLWISRAGHFDFQVIPVFQTLRPDLMEDLPLEYLGLYWHIHLYLCFLPYQHQNEKQWLSPCKKRLQVNREGKIIHVGEKIPS